ncbi:tetratricopeptide repeat-containing response regulator [Methylomonas methanica]|uniref:Response regulator receiver protein n=1 Tax=Methylomonas methanica (strain DSM 25384 / MC09) TaxID=857087 RepID=F9ZYE2_METMM|nr:tetratricopeptide repeat-containing response regulator [Methylomonas methanica]AEG01047.1 response regulator receiver protein [Methylomonas methanica MC09]
MKPILAGKSILIVEDYPAMRKAIRNMLYTLDADRITEADNGENALLAMSRASFDVVLCDYNLGAGKNGQQVLEEARAQKLISYACVFVIIAAEQSASMVLGAMDSKPDEYLAKPFNAQQLFVRLERNLARKSLLQTIDKEVERGNLSQAIQQCEKLLAGNHKKIRTHLLKMRAELATLVGDFDTGRQIYAEILDERDLPWARLGLGIIDFQAGDLAGAASHFEDLLRAHPLFLEGYDWLSKVYEAEDKLQDVQEVVNQAVDLSPQSILRQKKLAETADKIGNVEVAEKAYKAAVSLGKYSIYKSCSDFTNLAKLYTKTHAAGDALNTLAHMRKEFRNDPEAELRATTLEAELYQSSGDTEKAGLCLEKALSLHQQLGSATPKDLQLDIARGCFLQDQAGRAETILDGLIKTHIDDEQFLDDVRRMQSSVGMANHSEDLIQKTKRALVATNNKGVALYKQGKFKEAMALFEKAIASMPENKTIIINMLKIILHDLKASGIDEEKLLRAQALFKKARQIQIDRHKLGILQMEFSNLLRQYHEGAKV